MNMNNLVNTSVEIGVLGRYVAKYKSILLRLSVEVEVSYKVKITTTKNDINRSSVFRILWNIKVNES